MKSRKLKIIVAIGSVVSFIVLAASLSILLYQ